MVDILELGSLPFGIRHVFFAPAHLSRKHLFETTLTEKFFNTRDMMFGSEPGAGYFLPYNVSETQSGYSSTMIPTGFTIKPGLLDVVTLGMFFIIPFIIIGIPASFTYFVDSIRPLNDLVIWGLCCTAVAGLFGAIMMLARWVLGNAFTIALSPLVLGVHAVCSFINWMQSNPVVNNRDELPALIQEILTQLDDLIQSVSAQNRIEITIHASIIENRCIIQPVFKEVYRPVLTTDRIDKDGSTGERCVRGDKEIIDSLAEKALDCTNALTNQGAIFLEVLRAYEQRGLLTFDAKLNVLDDLSVHRNVVPFDAVLSHVMPFLGSYDIADEESSYAANL